MIRRVSSAALLSGVLMALLVAPAGAGAAVLYDQTDSPAPPGNRISSNQFPTQPAADDQGGG
jgi:CBS-domain-containing membrane protein